jgi:hypothetical protein
VGAVTRTGDAAGAAGGEQKGAGSAAVGGGVAVSAAATAATADDEDRGDLRRMHDHIEQSFAVAGSGAGGRADLPAK